MTANRLARPPKLLNDHPENDLPMIVVAKGSENLAVLVPEILSPEQIVVVTTISSTSLSTVRAARPGLAPRLRRIPISLMPRPTLWGSSPNSRKLGGRTREQDNTFSRERCRARFRCSRMRLRRSAERPNCAARLVYCGGAPRKMIPLWSLNTEKRPSPSFLSCNASIKDFPSGDASRSRW